MFDRIFYTNVVRLMGEKSLSIYDLHNKSGISVSFLFDLTKGKANPSLKKMEVIANALGIPLPFLLTNDEAEFWQNVKHGLEHPLWKLPKGYKRVYATLPDFQAYIVNKWDKECRGKIGKKQRKSGHTRVI